MIGVTHLNDFSSAGRFFSNLCKTCMLHITLMGVNEMVSSTLLLNPNLFDSLSFILLLRVFSPKNDQKKEFLNVNTVH